MAKPQIGDTRGWNERDQTGYKWEKTTRKPDGEWVQYWKGKPTQSRGFVDLFSGSKLKSAVIKEPTEEDKRLTAALDNFVKTKNQPSKQPIPPEDGNEFSEDLGIDTNDEFGSLLKTAINVLNKNPNDFNAKIAMNGMNFLYDYQNGKIAHDGTGAGDTYVNFPIGELDDEGQLVNTVQEDKQLVKEIPLTGITDSNNQTPEDIARDEWLKESRNTPAAKAFAQDDYRNEAWEDLRWQAQKRHKKLFDYNTDKEK